MNNDRRHDQRALRLVLAWLTDPYDRTTTNSVIDEIQAGANPGREFATLMVTLTQYAAGFANEAFGDDQAPDMVATMIEVVMK
jgi:hypothetical protein